MKAKKKINLNDALNGTSITINVIGIRAFRFKIKFIKALVWFIARFLKPIEVQIHINKQ